LPLHIKLIIYICSTNNDEIPFLFKGLVVPVIRNAEKMNFADVEKEINTLAKKANDGSISIDEMAGGTFTISNGGVYGSLLSTPIINPPQVMLMQLSWLLIYIYIFYIILRRESFPFQRGAISCI
jgi:pyruvate/2-oxoglutarate dehydrogenase complex dihydrolipoamide acyltransferase (E2) component